MAPNSPSHNDPNPIAGADTLSQANLKTKSSTNQLSGAPQDVVMSVEPHQSDIKNKADILFQKRIKAVKGQIKTMKKQLQKDEKRLADIKSKTEAEILFQKKIKAAKGEIKAMKKQLHKNEKKLVADEAHLRLVNGYRYLGETRVGGADVGARVGILEESLQYRAVLKGISPELMVNRERLDVQRLKSDIRVKEWRLEREIDNYHSDAEKSVQKPTGEKKDEGLASTEDLRSHMGTIEEFDELIGGML